MGEKKYAIAKGKGSSSSSSSSAGIANLLSQLSLKSKNPFARLASDRNMLLLTPYLHLPPPNASASVQMDPFEPFGRELSRYHQNIRHVPYVAKRGMIDVHKELIKQAGGLLVIVCDSSASKKYDGERLDGVKYQEKFAKEAGKMAFSLGIPSLLVIICLDDFEQKYFKNVLEIEDWADLEMTAGQVFTS